MLPRFSVFLLVLSIAGALALWLAVPLLMTVEYDEAWILASTRRVFDKTLLPSVDPVMTTGGMYLAAVGGLSAMGVPILLAGRGLVVLCLLALLYVIDRFARGLGLDRVGRGIVLAMTLAAPGTLLMGGMAYGVMPATLLLTLALLLWIADDLSPLWRTLGVGLCLGLAMATRWTILPVLPFFLVLVLLLPGNRKAALRTGLGATLVAGLCFGLIFWTHLQVIPQEAAVADTLQNNTRSAGLSSLDLPRLPRLLSFATRFVYLVPLPLLFWVIYMAWTRPDSLPPRLARFAALALLCAGTLTLAWVFRSPFLHLRYIFPAVFLVFVVAGFCLAACYRRVPFPVAALIVLIPVGLLTQSTVSTLRLAAAGAAMQVNSAGLDNHENHFRPFYLIREQEALREYLIREVSPESRVLAMGLPFEFAGRLQMSLLSDRQILADWEWPADATPDYLLTHDFSNITERGRDWLAANTEPVVTLSGYTLHRPVAGGDPVPPETFFVPYHLSRFSLPRELSLTGF